MTFWRVVISRPDHLAMPPHLIDVAAFGYLCPQHTATFHGSKAVFIFFPLFFPSTFVWLVMQSLAMHTESRPARSSSRNNPKDTTFFFIFCARLPKQVGSFPGKAHTSVAALAERCPVCTDGNIVCCLVLVARLGPSGREIWQTRAPMQSFRQPSGVPDVVRQAVEPDFP
jgi:hypothetical protein